MNELAVTEWTKKAEDNYVSARALHRRRKEPVPDDVCNRCHQCVEKYVKALLVLHKIRFPKIHDLVQLEELLAPIDPDIRLMHDYFVILNPYGIDIRYPGLDATIQEARIAIKAMKAVRSFVRGRLQLP